MPRFPADTAPESLAALLVSRFPDLAGSSFDLRTGGWHSVAVDVDGRLIFKFPRHAEAAEALRREQRLLEQVGRVVSIPVPRLELFEEPVLFSRHRKLAGEHLLAAEYGQFGEAARARLGEELGSFYAQLHGLPLALMQSAGAGPVEPWLAPATVLRRAGPLLDAGERDFAERTLGRWAALGPDPLGLTYGYFDGHGWNMAFDHAAGRLNGLYDFADSGIGPVHRDFIYSAMISPELTGRIVTAYERASGRQLDRERIEVLAGAHRLWELAVEAEDPANAAVMLNGLRAWMMHPRIGQH